MKTKHTPQPWPPKYIVRADGAKDQVFDSIPAAMDYASRCVYLPTKDATVVQLELQAGQTARYCYRDKTVEIEATAKEIPRERIVACINACEGIDPSAVPDMLRALIFAAATLESGEAYEAVMAALAKAEGRS